MLIADLRLRMESISLMRSLYPRSERTRARPISNINSADVTSYPPTERRI